MKDIMLRIVGRQINKDQQDDEETKVEFVTQARMYRKNNATIVLYNENELTTGTVDGVRAMLRISDDGAVRLKRYSTQGMGPGTTMEFTEGRRFESIYSTPFGALPMEILTNRVKNSIDGSGTGSLSIDYELAFRGISDARSMLDIEISDVPEGFDTKAGTVYGSSQEDRASSILN